ncbi:putative pectinesterase/pectinesterase inhibitor 28 [Arachis ipaensis]|uniref:putative pectinesterase/pectinesterase inhibitor 28 n=1 Tax=Arachis ipaensis TaxID=130454 RepID=UPI000A2B3D0B|nr:putative pectinesterase/pectinesterase inhibitor 28 [Arachis ipaensis]
MTTNLEESAEAKRRIAVIGISTVILVAMVVAVTVGVSQVDGDEKNTKNTNHVASTVKAVKALCQPTDYKEECEESLTAEAGNTTDPRELIKIAFNVTINKIGDGLQKSHLLQEVENEPRAKMALDTCKQLMNLSISEFSRSLERIGQFNLNNLDEILTSLKVWLSGAVTYQETCLDGFENTTSKAGEKMKEALTNATKMSSNALSIITELANTFSELNETRQDSSHRRLKDEFPSWVDNGAGVRRLLLSSSRKLKPNVIVAKDGSAKFTSINQALKNVPQKNMKPFVIFIKKGVYKEYVEVTREMRHVVFVGEGGDKTRITGNKNFIDGTNTYKTATVAIQGDYFIAINMGFENSAGAHSSSTFY